MTTLHEQFVERLEQDVAGGGMTAAERDDLLEQKALFDAALEANRTAHPNQVVGYVDGNKLVADSVPAILNEAKKYPGKMLYFEDMESLVRQ